MTEIFLIGAVHTDPKGPKALTDILEKLGPSLITVEVEPYVIPEYMRMKEYLTKAVS